MSSVQACLHDFFKAHAGKTADALAVVSHNAQTTCSDLDRDTDSLGEFFALRGRF